MIKEDIGEVINDRRFLKIYGPTEWFPFPHYKNGFRAFMDFPIEKRLRFYVSIISLAASILALIATRL